jgi:putative SOS response-associated peptidase YedK
MCARYNIRFSNRDLKKFLDVTSEPFALRYNIAPTQMVLTINQENGERIAKQRKWGLIPSWSKDTKLAATMINARSETVATKRAFRSAVKKRRCLIPTSGFYEWTGPPKAKQPWLIEFESGEPMVFAGLWESWKSPDDETIESCTILTTAANEFMHEMHDRMPLILGRENWDFWLDPEINTGEPYQQLFQPWCGESLIRSPMNPKLNSSKNEWPQIFEKLAAAPT